jgi:zinc D-Ala-D-Ala dipeptidase
MVGKGRGIDTPLSRRDVAIGLAVLPLAACQPAPRPAPGPRENIAPPLAAADPAALVELVKLDPGIRLDIRYATPNNFTGIQLYDEARAFLVSVAAQALMRAQAAAWVDGYGLLIHDAYRPWRITKKLWDMTPPEKREFVANPKEGSRHNRGCAVDLTLYERATGNAVTMPSGYDEFSNKAYRDYSGGSTAETQNRARLERYMEAEGFSGISNEWWHFDYKDWAKFPILDVPFSDI